MKFTCYGDKNKPAVLLMHGMCQDYRSMINFLGDLKENYYLIVPAMDGFYDGSDDFTNFADQCRQIEEYVNENFNGKLYGVYGISQGTIVLSELLARNNIEIEKAFFDGTYVAHQGKLSGLGSYAMFSNAKKNKGKMPKIYNVFMKLMGLSEKDLVMFEMVYWDTSNKSMKANMVENYTYHVKKEIANTKTEITLCCGSKEPYALKSHRIIKKYLPGCKEIVLQGYGHGQMIYLHGEQLAKMIVDCWKA